jgi:hypothetical protein
MIGLTARHNLRIGSRYPAWSKIGLAVFVITLVSLDVYYLMHGISAFSPTRRIPNWELGVLLILLLSFLSLGPFVRALFSLPFDWLAHSIIKARRRRPGACARCRQRMESGQLILMDNTGDGTHNLLCPTCFMTFMAHATTKVRNTIIAVQPLLNAEVYQFYDPHEMKEAGFEEEFITTILKLAQDSSTVCGCGAVPKVLWCTPSLILQDKGPRSALADAPDVPLCASCFASTLTELIKKRGNPQRIALPTSFSVFGVSAKD